MDLKVAVVIVCLCILAITSSEAAIPKCCVKTRTTISINVLRNVVKWYEQQSTGACDIPALKLYTKGNRKPICAPLKWKPLLVKRQHKQRATL
ncbi:C-C motif chemokine 27a [Lates japonicus]